MMKAELSAVAPKPASESSFGYKINIFHEGVQFNSSVIRANLCTFLSYRMKTSEVVEIPPHRSHPHPHSLPGTSPSHPLLLLELKGVNWSRLKLTGIDWT